MHVIKSITGFGSKGELTPIGNGKAMYATGDIITLIPPYLGEYSCTYQSLLGLMQENNIEKSVLLQTNYVGFQNLYAYEAMNTYPESFLAAGTLDPFCKNKEAIIKHLFDDLKLRVIKMEVSTGSGLMANHDCVNLAEEPMLSLYEMAKAHNLVFVFDIGRPGNECYQIENVYKIAKAYQELTFVICHLTAPQLNDRDILKKNLELLKLPNVYFDLSSLPNNTRTEEYPFPVAQSYIRMAIDIVGSNHLMWGSDAPQAITKWSMKEVISYIMDSSLFTQTEKEDIFYNTASHVYLKK